MNEKFIEIIRALDPSGDSIISRIVACVIILVVGLILMKILIRITRKALSHSRLDSVIHTFIINCIKIVFVILLIITILGSLGVSTTHFITVLGACGAAVALALKDSLGNFAGGILIMINQPFSRGDYIESNGLEGKVREIDLLYSTLVTLDNKIISIPNGLMANNTIINYSDQENRRVDCKFGIGYGCDIAKAKSVIQQVIDESHYFLDEPEPVIGVSEHGDSAVIIDTLAWCRNDDYLHAKYYLQEHVKLAFDREEIEIPFPQCTVHFDKEDQTVC